MSQLAVGDTIQNQITHEEGHIVRIVKIGGHRGYVVTTMNKASGNQIEALWRPQELIVYGNHSRKARTCSARVNRRFEWK
jgi:acetolactate synthase regulatory subunit